MEQETHINDIWSFITSRNETIVQNKEELERICSIAKECSSYLEIGSAEGNSLYAVSKSLANPSKIVCVDREQRTLPARMEIIKLLENDGIRIEHIDHDSHSIEAIKELTGEFDLVYIDAGHDYEDVIMDAVLYGSLAKKYIIFHDMCMEGVERAVNWYSKYRKREFYKFGNEFVLGIMKI